VASLDLLPTVRVPLFKDGSLADWEGIEMLESNALGLVFIYEDDDLDTKAVTTFTQQAESLRAPLNHQDGRSCDRPNQKYHAQQVRMAFQPDGPTDDTLVSRFPQDIGLRGEVSDLPGSMVSKAQ
jgi:hypothetical protein